MGEHKLGDVIHFPQHRAVGAPVEGAPKSLGDAFHEYVLNERARQPEGSFGHAAMSEAFGWMPDQQSDAPVVYLADYRRDGADDSDGPESA